MARWVDIPIGNKLFENVDPSAVTSASAALENAFINEADGQSRFPGLVEFVDLDGEAPTYLFEWRGNMIAVSGGRIYEIDEAGNAVDVTGVSVGGSGRVMFDATNDELLMAAGAEIVRFRHRGEGDKHETELLSKDAPLSTHAVFIDNYVVAVEANSGRFQHSQAGQSAVWEALDIFSAESKPDDITAALVTPYRELLMCGPQSIEQFERLTSGTTPFFRRWAVGEGLLHPYLITFADNAAMLVNKNKRLVRTSGQSATPIGEDIALTLEDADDWTDAWMSSVPDLPLNVKGQQFIILQLPNATNEYGTKGITFAYDIRQSQFSRLYGWDDDLGVPTRWPGWSHYPLWDRQFVGGNGKIYRLDRNAYDNDGKVQKMLGRTANMADLGEVQVNDIRIRLKRGGAALGATAPVFNFRAIRDESRASRWVSKSLGTHGHRAPTIYLGGFGNGEVWQFEWFVTDPVPVEIVQMSALVTSLRTHG